MTNEIMIKNSWVSAYTLTCGAPNVRIDIMISMIFLLLYSATSNYQTVHQIRDNEFRISFYELSNQLERLYVWGT